MIKISVKKWTGVLSTGGSSLSLKTHDIFSVNAVALAILKFFELLIFGFEDLKPVGVSLLVRDRIRLTRSVKIDPLRP
ncbi:hypothetical protein RintRC_5677 [Richelia intracellularis]|nr:hypothetical protein RintRC_5677 [Richelia intracellularis]